jgi:hypothetical protein
MDSAPSPWPRFADAWWVYTLGGVALVLFPLGLITRLRCGHGRCAGSVFRQLLDLDSIGGLPRLFITGLFLAVCALGWVALRRCAGRARTWWTAISGIGLLLAVAKLVSAHSVAKSSAPMGSLVVGVLLAALALSVLLATGRRWGIEAARPITVALGAYAAAALGLDAVTSAVEAAQQHAGALSAAASTYVEELGEALTALLVVVTVRWHLPRGAVLARSGAAPRAGRVLQDSRTGSNTPEAGAADSRQSGRQQ